MTIPFRYPPSPHVFRHGPQGYSDPTSFRPWLRDEYSFRCVYCLRREQWSRSQGEYDLDHLFSVARHPELIVDYENFRYACSVCNALKSDKFVPDPCLVLLDPVVFVSHNGTMLTDSAEAAQLIDELGLNSDDMVEYCGIWIEVIAMAEIHHPALFRQLMGFPKDLPDLNRLRPPAGNSRPEGINKSFWERRKRNELPEVY